MNSLQQLANAIALATALGGEVMLPAKAALLVMNSTGIKRWEDLAAAANADISYDSGLRAFRLTALKAAGPDIPTPAPLLN